jgi:hypothetical protein
MGDHYRVRPPAHPGIMDRMPRKTAFPALLAFIAASASLASPDAYDEGSVVVELRGAILTYGSADLADIYGPDYFESSGFGAGVGAGAGLGYALTPAFHLVAAWEPVLLRRHRVIWEGGAEDRWSLDASSFLGGVRWFVITSDVANLYLGLAAGRYALSRAHVEYTYVDGTANFSGSTFGGVLELGGQKMLTERLSLVAGLGYRLARISRVRVSGTVGGSTSPPQDMLNEDGSRAAIDLSGLAVFVGLDFSPGAPGR